MSQQFDIARCTWPKIGALAVAAMLALPPVAFPAQEDTIPQPKANADETLRVLREAERMAAEQMSSHPGTASQNAPVGRSSGAPGGKARLYVFVSFSMPPATLQRLATQAAALNTPLVLRGMVGESLAMTARRAADVVNAVPGTSFEIDPAPFARFGIERVPSFVIATPPAGCTEACMPDQTSEVLTGDVTLDYALDRLARGNDVAASLARDLLARMRRKP